MRKIDNNIQQNVDSSTSKVLRIDNIKDKVIPLPVLKEGKTLEEIIIESYDYIFLVSDLRRFSFLVEGNFTGSGNKEIIGFYQDLYNIDLCLSAALCFVGNSSGENIENIYLIDWVDIYLFTEESEADIGLTEALGRYIIWKDQKIGCISDFNENGKEELFLLEYGYSKRPHFWEFDEIGFVQVLDIGTSEMKAYITGVNPIEKIIDIRISHQTDQGGIREPPTNAARIVNNNSYIWDNSTRRYEFLKGETKEYGWDWETKQYFEIKEFL